MFSRSEPTARMPARLEIFEELYPALLTGSLAFHNTSDYSL